MSLYDCSKDLVHDLTIENSELRDEIKKLKDERNEEKRLRLIAQIDCRFMARKLEKAVIVHCLPHRVDENKYECGDVKCSAELSEDYSFCPGCGAWIDWNNTVDARASRPLSEAI